MASYSNKRIPIPEGKAKEKRRSFLPAPKTFGLQKEKQEEPRLFSPPPEDHADEELHVGDRIVISGVKSGTLLYFGKTHIASGFWCGIELDEPDGKHDGSVEGVRYFECRVGHGIFAPADRVSKPEGSVEDTTETLRQLPQPKTKVRRLLPQPKAFNKPENIESLLRSKILEEQEEFQYRSEPPRIAQQQKAHYQQDYLYDRSNLNIDDLLTEQYGDSCVKKLSSTFTLSEGSRRSESEDFSHKSPRRSQNYGHQQYQGQGCVSTELEVTGNALNNTYILPTEKIEQLNRIYTDSGFILPSEKIEQLNRTHNDSGSSGDDSIGPELKECLSSDGRKYFNLTFDTEGNNSPKHFSNSRNSDTIHHEISNEYEVKTTPVPKSNQMSESMSSSLGVLDLEDVLFQTELLTDDLIDSSNLTDIEKIVQSCDKTKRVASLNDTFENKSVITSTPLVTEKSKSLLDRTRTISNSKSGISTGIPEEVAQLSDDQILQNLRHNLNSTFQADQTRGVELPIVGDDTLDWRQEASDSEEQQSDDSLEESYSKNLLQGYNEKGNLNVTYTSGLDANTNSSSRNDSLSEKLENLRLDKEDSIHSNKELSFQKVQSGLTREQIQKFDKPMTDSGISVKGLTDSTNSLQSSTEGIIYRQRKPMTDSGISLQSDYGMADSQEMRWSQNLDSLQELTENSGLEEKQFGDPTQLERDLKAGHKKRDRPLSLISTTSADTGYVPDTDSEMGTVTMNSPTEWTDRKTDDHKVTDLDQAYAETFKHYQSAVLKGTRRAKDLESDSDMYSDAGTIIADTDTLREISSDIDIICGSLSEAKEVLSEQVPSLDLQKVKVQTPAPTDENVEDERIEADQQLDLVGGKNQDKDSAKAEIPQVNIEIVDQDGTTTTTDEKKDGDGETDANKESSKTPRKMTPKKKELEKSDYKKPKVASRLADYINQPVPELSEEEKLERAKNRKNKFQKNVVKKVEKEDKNTSHSEERHKKVEKEPPKIIKRTPPKSKWDAVMNKIENNQSAPPKPKTEVKSKLQEYLSAPTPVKKETEIKPPKKVSNMPTPDYSKIKSKLNLAAPPPASKKIDNKKKSKLPAPGNLKRHSSVSSNASSLMKLDLNDSVGSSSQVFGSALTSARSSCSDLHKEVSQDSKSHDRPSNPSVGRLSMPGKRERRDSTSSTISNISQGSSSRAVTDRSNKVGERVSLRRQSMPVKSSIPPPTDLPRKSSVASRINTGTNKVNKTLATIKDLPSPTKRDTNSNKNKTKTKNVPKPSHRTEPEPKLTLSHAKQEILRLEALCENRTKELNIAKFEMKSCLSGFDAMSALVNYLSNDLKAFSCPKLAAQLHRIQQQLTESHTQTDDLKTHKSRLEQEIADLCTKHEQEKQGMVEENEKALAAEIVKFTLEKTRALQITEETQMKVLKQLKEIHSDEISRLKLEHTEDYMRIQIKHKDDILRLQHKHEGQMEVSWYQMALWELHKQHRDKLEEITKRFEAMKLNLADKVETLRTECDELRVRARDSEEMLLRDSDIKVQMAVARYRHMPAEIESLKQVLDMRNEEIFKLRNKNIDLGRAVDELNVAKDKILALNQKIENLEAIITMKTDHEKQMNDKCQMLMKKFDKESKVNKRLSMDYEELMWRMSQSEGSMENLLKVGESQNPGDTSSPVLRRKTVSPVVSEQSPLRSPAYRRSLSSNVGEKSQDKKWKRKSASYLYEEKRTSPSRCSPTYRTHLGSDSLPNSPRTKTSGRNNRMSHSCNDADVFEGPQPLPSPVAPPELSNSLDSDYFTSDKTDSSDKDTSTTISQSEDSISVTIFEKSNGVMSPDTNHEDISEMSHSTDSNGVNSLVWDYEKFDSSCKSMESSRSMESSVASDTILEGNDASDNCTFSNSSTVEDISMPHSPDKGGEITMSQECNTLDSVVEFSPQNEVKESKGEDVQSKSNSDLPKSKIPSFIGMRESTV
ncbi:CAP-Gly domain-containing linker protein 1-like isoform X4 [Mytilus californianus]|uniref:CAP-Gly domain-containing linker protein 1-like isoform X3 n=1 Tax=Mytilus californianus TaxID=6549 RepID=UPI002246DAE7|nr:CAP-Gly domain-containing linker protein 1-like isoform X3 [Mytilus californianus]XP_052089529.1 CAP-Gly domain-containing linker protein 1-like isoform X4 [Mytilus californianus]